MKLTETEKLELINCNTKQEECDFWIKFDLEHDLIDNL